MSASAAPPVVKGPCAHDVSIYDTKDRGRLPIMMAPYPLLWSPRELGNARLWCRECGWVKLTNEQFRAIDSAFGGHA